MDTKGILDDAAKHAVEMERLLTNYKKEGKRKTRESIQRRLAKIEERWKEFQSNHIQLDQHLSKDDEYFKNDFYGATQKVYMEAKFLMEEKLKELSSDDDKTQHPVSDGQSSDEDDAEARSSSKTELSYTGVYPKWPDNPLRDFPNFSRSQEQLSHEPQRLGEFSGSRHISWGDDVLRGGLNFGYSHARKEMPLGDSAEKLSSNKISENHERNNVQTFSSFSGGDHSKENALPQGFRGPNFYQSFDQQGFAGQPQNVPGYYFVPFMPQGNQWTQGPNFSQFNTPFPGPHASHRPKLPPVKIGKFSGKAVEWKGFYELFIHIIHNDPYLHDTEKFSYLLSYLDGDAKKVISKITPIGDNYKAALKLLKERYDNKREIIMSHIDILTDMKKVGQNSATDIITLHDQINEALEGLRGQGCCTENWDPLIIGFAIKKLDTDALRYLEELLPDPTEMPTLAQFMTFLRKRHRVLKANDKEDSGDPESKKKGAKKETVKKSFHLTSKMACFLCKEAHGITNCPKFQELTSYNKRQTALKLDLCLNCLSHKKDKECKSKRNCQHCDQKHHTLLHYEKKSQAKETKPKKTDALVLSTDNQEEQKDSEEFEDSEHVSLHTSSTSPLFPTILMKARANGGDWHYLRALLDTGSGDSFISERAAQELALPRERINAPIRGIGGSAAAVSKHQVQIILAPRFPSTYKLEVGALVLSSLTGLLPQQPIKTDSYKGLKVDNILMADPTFMTPGPIDMILGAQIYASILKNGIKRSNTISAQNTEFGWILTGSHSQKKLPESKIISMISMAEIDRKLQLFWEMDQHTEPHRVLHRVEKEFAETHSRTEDGRYVVQLPFKGNPSELGDSKKQAMARFINMEKKFATNEQLRKDYSEFIHEYISLGHMSLAPPDGGKYYLPHHAVFKKESSTTKTRVVFDASCKTSTGKSLNSVLHAGPKLQQNLNQIIIRWCKYKYVYTADIEKMFRQIIVAEGHRDYLRILWRDSPEQPIREYRLNTVTYGTAPATYLSVKVLMQLAEDEGAQFPAAVAAIKDFYVDDVMTGADTVEGALQIQNELINLLQKGGMNLRKWTSNKPELLANLSEEQIEAKYLQLTENETLTALGVGWDPNTDQFSYKIKPTPRSGQMDKRMILSDLASIYDPIGWLAPVTIRARLIMQRACKDQVDWNKPVSKGIVDDWKEFLRNLPEVEKIRIPRYMNYSPGANVQLHGFSDASEKAYGAVVYARVEKDSLVMILPLAAKTRVVPLDKPYTMPRLELCGAVLLAELLDMTLKTLDIADVNCHAWIDSKIVLAWLRRDASEWGDYVAQRIEKIHKYTDKKIWQYVSTEENPADLLSRGICPSKLRTTKLWWRGPTWLKDPEDYWPDKEHEHLRMVEEACMAATSTSIPLSLIDRDDFFDHMAAEEKIPELDIPENELLDKYDSLSKTIRIAAYYFRFINLLKKKEQTRGPLTTKELREAELFLVKSLQAKYFGPEVYRLQKKLPILSKSKILSLSPFLDEDGLLRVGGRLENSELPYGAKHPVLIPQKSHLANLIIREAHHSTLHGGISLTLNYLRNKYWIPNSRNTVKSIIDKCLICFRHKRHTPDQLMGNLPHSRVTSSPPFTSCGVDFAGPFFTRASKVRGVAKTKSYIAIFVCFSTKAVHMELVSDLTKEAFLAAFKRFISRRGKPANIYSDNGTNLVGAKNVLEKELKKATKDATENASRYAAEEGIQWHLIPPAAPHFGGLWEAAVKSAKKHLKIVLRDTTLSYEEFTTVLTRVEAALNSRPISPLSNDPNDLSALSPGHFLIGRQILAPPEDEVEEEEPLRRWKKVTRLNQSLWKRWSRDYLQHLQQRYKWQRLKEPVEIGDLVLITDGNIPPQRWPLARVIRIHPGSDGINRVVDLKTKDGEKRRPITKIAKLPIDQKPDRTDSDFRQTPSTSNFAWANRQNNRPRFRNSSWKSTLLFMLLALFTLGATQTHSHSAVRTHNYTIVEPQPGLYVEELGVARLKRGILRIETDYRYDQFSKDRLTIEDTLKNTSNACREAEELTHDVRCKYYIEHLRHKVGSVIEKIENIYTSAVRKRRGLLGQALTYVFGVNDEVYRDIEELQQSQRVQMDSINQHNMLLSAKVDHAIEQINAKMSQYTQKMNQVIQLTEELRAWNVVMDHNRVRLEVLAMYTSASDYLEELDEFYERLMRARTGRGNILDFASRKTLNETIRRTLDRIGSDYQVVEIVGSKVDFTINADSIQIFGKLYILEKQRYKVLHITPVPMRLINGSFLTPDLESETIAVDFNSQTFFEFRHEGCTHDLQSGYVCAPHAVHDLKERPTCVIDQIYNRYPKKSCKATLIELKGILWKKLTMNNVWLFISSQPESIAIICQGIRDEHVIENVGIIKILGGCAIESGTMSLRASIESTTKVSSSFVKRMDFTLLEADRTAAKIKIQNPQPLKSFEPITTAHIPEVIVNTHHNWVMGPSFTIPVSIIVPIILLVAWTTRRMWLRCCRRELPNEDQPEPEEVTLSERFRRLLHNRFQEASSRAPPAQDVHDCEHE